MSEPGSVANVRNNNDNNESYVDVIIGMDATGSMGGWINAARDTVLQAFEDLRTTYPNAHFRLGVVCYRDYDDNERFVIHPLTSDIPSIQNALRNVAALGGNDTAEDVAGGMHHILAQFRELNPHSVDPTRVLLFVADAPPHGARYHGPTVGDRYPKGDPEGRDLFDTVRQLAHLGVDMTLFRINASVDKMIEELAVAFEGTDSTFTLLDIAGQNSQSAAFGVRAGSASSSIDPFDLSAPPASSGAFGECTTTPKPRRGRSSCDPFDLSARCEESLSSGFIDLASYDSDAYKPSAASSNIHYMASPMPSSSSSSASSSSSSSASPADYMRSATSASVSSSVQKRLERRSAKKE